MSATLPKLPMHRAISAERALILATDDRYGISHTAPGPRGFLIFSLLLPPRFAPNAQLVAGVDSGPLTMPAEVAQEANKMGLALADAVFEVAMGAWLGGRTHLRLVDVVRADGLDLRQKPLTERQQKLMELRRRVGWRLELLESSHLTSGKDKPHELNEGPGRAGALIAFRRLSGPYGQDWLVAPPGFRVKIHKSPEVEFGQPLPPAPHPLFRGRP